MNAVRFMRCLAVLLLLPVLFARSAEAHEARPGYLELTELRQARYDVLWKQPANGDMALRLTPVFPAGCALQGADDKRLLPGALVSRFTLSCDKPLEGQAVTIAGLETTLTDVLVRFHRLDGNEETHLAQSTAPTITIGDHGGGWVRAGTYLWLGIQHILMGIDHLAFVLGLLLIVRNRWMLLKTISAFTLAHSITLATATFGYVSVPSAPLNASIALSILFLGPEILRAAKGGTSLTIRQPWIVAFAFGLLHGFGFASGLTAMGLNHAEIPLALLLFNVGVELGQLGFVLLILGLERAFCLMEIRWPRPAALIPSYSVGVLGAFWTLQRLYLFFGSST